LLEDDFGWHAASSSLAERSCVFRRGSALLGASYTGLV
jgi:hypothetical protein